MGKNSKRVNGIRVASAVMALSLFGGIATSIPAFSTQAETSSYVELYSPLNQIQISMDRPEYLSASVKNNAKTESGKGLALDYTAGHTGSVNVTLPLTITETAQDFKGLAMWVDVPETADTYSFTMYIVKNQAVWQDMNMASPLTMISEDGEVTEKLSVWKRQQLNGFTGWVMMPLESYADPVPTKGVMYNVVIMMEDAAGENAKRTEDMEMTIGSFGYYTDYTGFLYEKAGADIMAEKTIAEIDGYIADVDALQPKNEKQTKLKNKMLVYFSNLKENFKSLSEAEQLKTAKGLYDEYYARMEEYLYGDIRKTDYIMSFALTSDTHFSNTWVNTNYLNALKDAKTLDPELAGMFVLGDISNEGVSPTDDSLTELDNYYDWLDSYAPTYLNSKGEQIPIINVMGNHDVRGPSTEPSGKYPSTAYEPAVEMYLEREALAKEAGSIQFDTWINGYHFIFLNSDKYHSDDAYLSQETLEWLDETLSENEDGRPMFVMIHQPVDNVRAMSGATTTFREVIARHPSAIVSSGHTHDSFSTAKVEQDGKGVFVNQPAMVQAATQYYFVEVYEGGVIYRARECATNSWVISSDVVVANEDMSNNVLFNAENFDSTTLTTTNVTASIEKADSVSGKALKLIGSVGAETVSIPVQTGGLIENYAGYALFAESDSLLKVSFAGKNLKANATYYSIVNGNYVEKTTNENGEIVADGWVVIPKDSIDGVANPSAENVFAVTVGASQTVYLDKVSYYFNAEDFLYAVTKLPCVFYNDDGSVISSGLTDFGSALNAPANPEKTATQEATYAFDGWDLDGDGIADELPASVNGAVSATAVYTKTLKKYTYTFYAEDKTTVLLTQTVDYGSAIETPAVEGLFGWDLDGDGACEGLPATLSDNLTAYAVLGEPPYENATVIFDPAKLSTLPISTYSYNSAVNLCTVNALPVKNDKAPTGKVAQFNYKYTDGQKTQNGSDYVQIDIPYTGDTTGFQGYAIWVDVPETTEDFIGGLKINSQRLSGTFANGWTLISSDGTVTTQKATWQGEGDFPRIGTGFTGWVIVDKSIYGEGIEPNANGYMYFQIHANGRTTPYTMNIGEILFYTDKEAIIAELSANTVNTLNYSFTDGNGYVYKSGQVGLDESIVVPEDPKGATSEVFFAGWDTNGDNLPDELPVDGKITKDLKAVAVFSDSDAFTTFSDGSTGYTKENSYITVDSKDYASAPKGKATLVTLNENGDAINTSYVKLSLPVDETATGIAVWMDASSMNSFRMQFFKKWAAKMTVAEGGDYVYFYGEDGSLSSDAGWRHLAIPANFKGWVIMPISAFWAEPYLANGDYLRFGFAFNGDGNSNLSGEFYFGEAVTFNCSVEQFMKQIDKRVYAFQDYDGSFISCGILEDGVEFVAPQDPTREDWNFVGWDINGDGVADTLPTSTDRTFRAVAIYDRQFTYKFVDKDGNVLSEKTTDYNSLILPPFRYEESLGVVEHYTLVVDYGGYEEGMLLTEDVTFVVTYERVATKYAVTFFDEDGTTEISSSQLEYGASIVLPTAPEKQGYVFKEWQGYTDGMTVTGNHSFIAVYEEVAGEDDVLPPDDGGNGEVEPPVEENVFEQIKAWFENTFNGLKGKVEEVAGCQSSISGGLATVTGLIGAGFILGSSKKRRK